ncbi:hypothetical protein S7711_02759 [Stachybotrys chartarum IBT 7711]|uniref:Uncharacterized protein n=1 Tax=Stachybotrys chartarum (strain CBS 109288 / IBT 7711) TaxID=1280523 RepID=A0A084ALW7_STACB|nr:hypothetical protein S7711_02759 [Stachybotrys chartarum IBT 7711]
MPSATTPTERQRRILQLSQQWGINLPSAAPRVFRPPQPPVFQTPGDDKTAEDLLVRRAHETAPFKPQKSSLSRAFSSNRKSKTWEPRDILEILSQWIVTAGSPGVAQALIVKLTEAGVDMGGSPKQRSGVLNRRRSFDASTDRTRLLRLAVEANQPDMVHVLLPHADPISLDTCLPVAIRLGNAAIVDLLLKYGANASQTADGQDAFRQACVAEGYADMIGLLLQSDGRPSPVLVTHSLCDAAQRGPLETVMELSRSTADGNHNSAEALKSAIARGRRDMAIAIIMGNQPPQRPGLDEAFELLYDQQNIDATTKLEIAELLLCAGAHGDVVSRALERSCESQFFEMAHLLATYGASLEFNDGAVLKTAIARGQIDLIGSLLHERSTITPQLASSCVKSIPKQVPFDIRAYLLSLFLQKGAQGKALDECLIDATEAGDANSVDLLLKPFFPGRRASGGQPPNHARHAVASTDYKGGEALRTAILRGDVVMTGKLLSGQPSPETLTALFPLTRKLSPDNRYQMIEMFLQGPLPGSCLHNALQEAISEDENTRDDALIRLLLQHNADVNFNQGAGLQAVIARQDVQLLNAMMQKASPQTAAARVPDVMKIPDHRVRHDMMSMLVRAGASIGVAEISSSLSDTLMEKPVDMSLLRLLLEHGNADINAFQGAIIKSAILNPDPNVLGLILGHGKPTDESISRCLVELGPTPSTEGKAWKLNLVLSRPHKKQDLNGMLASEVQSLIRNHAQQPALSTLKRLLESDADPNAFKAAALCHAVVAANSQILDMLLACPKPPTPLSLGLALPHALRISDSMDRLSFTKKLLEAGASPQEANRALTHAIGAYPSDLSLLSILSSAADTSDGEALGLSVLKESPEVLNLLLTRSKHSQDARDSTLGKAMSTKNRALRHAMSQRLLTAGVAPEAASTALLVAAREGDLQLGDLLMSHGAFIAGKSSQAVIEACRGGSVEVLEVLLKTDVNIEGKSLEKAFQAATEVGDLSKRAMIFEQLVKKGVAGALVDAQLSSAARCGQDGQAILRVLLVAGADPNYNNGEPVVLATRSAFIGSLELLLGLWDSGNHQKKASPPTLIRALKACWDLTRDSRHHIIKDLMKAGLPVTDDLHIALNDAVNEDDPEERLVRLLLDHGASPGANGSKTLIDAAQRNAASSLPLLLSKDVSIDEINRAYQQAFTADNIDTWFSEAGLQTSRMLLGKGARGNALSTALILVMAHSATNPTLADQFVDLLVSHGVDVDFQSGQPLREAASKANPKWTRKLLECHPSANTLQVAFHHIFDTALSQEDALELFQIFTEYHDDNVRIDSMATPPGAVPVLVQAISQFPRSLTILETLLNAGYYHDQMTTYQLYPDIGLEEVTLLTWAIAQPQKRISSTLIQLLLDRGAKVNVETSLSRTTPLMLAVQERRPDVVKMLLLDGAEVDVLDHQGRTPLSLATQIGGNIAIQMLGSLLAAEPSKDDGSLHNAARELNLPAVRVLVQAGHDPDFPSPLHDGRSALAEVCRHGSDDREMNAEREREMQKVMAFLVDSGSDLSIKSNGKSLLHLCFDAQNPVTTTRIFLKTGMWKHINKAFNRYSDGDYTYSPTMYLLRVSKNSAVRDELLTLLRANRAIDVYYANEGPQPEGAVGLPEDMEIQERARKARLQQMAEETQDHAILLARRREIASVEQQIWADRAGMEDARRRRLQGEDLSAIRNRAQLEESLSSAAIKRRLSEQRVLTDASLSRTRAIAAVEMETEEARQHRALQWEANLNTERVDNARALSAMRLGEREEMERIESTSDSRIAQRLERQQKLVESQQKLARQLAEGPQGNAAQRQIGYITELN